ncbi:MAG: ABC transporter permease [Cytophagales bacterium]|jgi:oligopeptide transport system permease protein|nr:ABC transporter permease [Cytophagales bacterium]
MQVARKYFVDIAGEKIFADKIALTSFFILFFIFVLILFVPECFPTGQYMEMDFFSVASHPCLAHPFGTDHLGRDIALRVFQSGRYTLCLALIVTFVSSIFGSIYGLISGSFSEKIDAIMMGLVNVLYAIPFLFFAILLLTVFENNYLLLLLAIACVSWLDVAKVVRGQTIILKKREFVEAAKISGAKSFGIIFGHIIKSLMGHIVVFTTLTIPNVLSLTVFLGFLGLGMQPPMIGWGELISEGVQYLSLGYWWILFFPAIFLILSLMSIYFLNNRIRDAFLAKDSKSRYIM